MFTCDFGSSFIAILLVDTDSFCLLPVAGSEQFFDNGLSPRIYSINHLLNFDKGSRINFLSGTLECSSHTIKFSPARDCDSPVRNKFCI